MKSIKKSVIVVVEQRSQKMQKIEKLVKYFTKLVKSEKNFDEYWCGFEADLVKNRKIF